MSKWRFVYALVSVSGGALLLLVLLAGLSSPVSAAQAAGSFTDCNSVTGLPLSECEALISIYNATGGSTWNRHANWLVTDTPCSWEGVTCVSGHISVLDLQRNNLTGNFPISITTLISLTELYLNGNWDLGSSSGLTGAIPPELSNLTNLKKLYLNNTELSGSLPVELGNLTNLEELNLCENYFLDIPVVPPFINNLTHLKYLNLMGLGMQGAVPSELGNLTDLETLILYYNNLTGTIPSALGNLPYLSTLGLNHNQLSGDIPESLVNLGAMVFFSLDYNRLNTSGCSTALVTYLNAADPTWALTQFVEEPVPYHGLYSFTTPRVELDFPVEVVTMPFTMTYTPQSQPSNDLGVLKFANVGFQLTGIYTDDSAVTTFSQPVTLTLTYTDTEIGGVDENTLHLYFWNTVSNRWEDAANTCTPASVYVRLPAENKLSLQICHLTEFALADLAKVYLPLIRR